MGQIMAHEIGREPDPDVATRTGEFAMLIYSIGMLSDVSFIVWLRSNQLFS